ncbi:MAG: ABC transporter permease [Planctomycetota bacterium]|jgi:putative ABC transport system permease protein
MKGCFYLAWRYLYFNWLKTLVLVSSITLILYIPAGLRVLVHQSKQQLTARADVTPLVIGSKGSPLELILNSVYFSADVPELIPFREVTNVAQTGLAMPIPIYARFHSHGDPIVGTSLDYFDFRKLTIKQGRQIGRLGDCVVGARVAAKRNLKPGDSLISSPEKVFDIAGVYPLKMKVTGVLDYSNSSDDDAIFVDIKTTWIIEGLAHGHEDLSRPEAAGRVLKNEGRVIVGNASVVEYTEITDKNINSFHFHGDPSDFNMTAILAVPDSQKSETLLSGRYKTKNTSYQILKPNTILNELLATILTIEGFVITALLLVGLTTLVTAALVFILSLRLRKREIETMIKIGGGKLHIGTVLVLEVVITLAFSVGFASVLTGLTGAFSAHVLRAVM